MSFLKRQQSSRKKSALSLQTFYSLTKHTHTSKSEFPVSDLISPKKNSNSFLKRTSFDISLLQNNQGSIIVESAIAIPIFLFAIIAILSFSEILRVQMKLNSAMQQTAKEMAVYGYALKEMAGEQIHDFNVPISTAFSETYVRNQVLYQFSDEYLKNSPIQGTRSITFLGSKIMEQDRIELYCTYHVIPFLSLSDKAGFYTQSTAVVRAFTGYDNSTSPRKKTKEQYVYVTETGKVYHMSRDCNYLDLSIHSSNQENIVGLRNKSGAIYKKCPLCSKNDVGGVVYITDYGEGYHYDLLCSGLKRTIHSVLLSEVGGMPKCSKCGMQ